MSLPDSYTPSIGYFPRSFPRDPVNVNIYLEHLLLGQVIEPLVESAPDGRIVPAVAESWTIKNEGKDIEFTIRNGITFSNGKPVTSADVKFTLERHAKSQVSQSRPFLKKVVAIEIVSDRKFVIKLDGPYVALFKAISREQLGILPADWTFNPNSDEPFIGTGAYRALKTPQGWVLSKNALYRDASSVKIPKWKVLMNPEKNEWKNYETADFVPFATSDTLDEIGSTKEAKTLTPYSESVIHFFQSSIWCYPHGKTCQNESRKQLGTKVMAELVKRCIKRNRLTPATGIIPQGIPGYLSELPKVKYDLDPSLKDRTFHLAALTRDYEMLNSAPDLADIEKEFNVKLSLSPTNPTILDQLPKNPPDFIAVSYAGGFHDPEGFLIIVPPVLQAEISSVFGKSFSIYKEASETLDWNRRSEIYKELNKSLVETKVLVPGWKHDAVRFRKPFIQTDEASLRYMARLKDFYIDTRKQ